MASSDTDKMDFWGGGGGAPSGAVEDDGRQSGITSAREEKHKTTDTLADKARDVAVGIINPFSSVKQERLKRHVTRGTEAVGEKLSEAAPTAEKIRNTVTSFATAGLMGGKKKETPGTAPQSHSDQGPGAPGASTDAPPTRGEENKRGERGSLGKMGENLQFGAKVVDLAPGMGMDDLGAAGLNAAGTAMKVTDDVVHLRLFKACKDALGGTWKTLKSALPLVEYAELAFSGRKLLNNVKDVVDLPNVSPSSVIPDISPGMVKNISKQLGG